MAWYQPTDDKQRANKSRNEKPSRGRCPTGNTVLGPELKPAEVTVVHNEWRMKRLQISDESPKAQSWKTPEIGNSPEKKKRREKKKETTQLEARYKVYPNMNPAEDNSSRPQLSYKKTNNKK